MTQVRVPEKARGGASEFETPEHIGIPKVAPPIPVPADFKAPLDEASTALPPLDAEQKIRQECRLSA